jgi:hypothetical protein
MRDLLFWTWVVGGAPLALALIRRAVEWLRDVARSGMVVRTHAAGARPASDSSLLWKHV